MKPGVNHLVAGALGLVHIVQLGKDHVIGIFQRIDLRDLFSIRPPHLFHAEIRIDQDQRFHRNIIQLQIPGGMVRRDMADIFHMISVKPLGRVVIMKIGNPLVGLAAEFSQVMTGGRSGSQGQIDGHSRLLQSPGHRHRHVMNAGDMLQRLKGRRFLIEPHHFINILIPKFPHKMGVLSRPLAGGIFLLRQKREILKRVKGNRFSLLVEEKLQDVQI